MYRIQHGRGRAGVSGEAGRADYVDQDVVMLESMKMQIPVQATTSGTVKALKANEGDFVNEGDVLIEVE